MLQGPSFPDLWVSIDRCGDSCTGATSCADLVGVVSMALESAPYQERKVQVGMRNHTSYVGASRLATSDTCLVLASTVLSGSLALLVATFFSPLLVHRLIGVLAGTLGLAAVFSLLVLVLLAHDLVSLLRL